jgi:hypothetical protein
MPTHQDFPDSHFDDFEEQLRLFQLESKRRRIPLPVKLYALVALIVVALVFGHPLLGSLFSKPRSKSRATPAAAQRATTPTLPGPGATIGNSPQTLRPGSSSDPNQAITGYSLGAGNAAQLTVVGHSGFAQTETTITSASPAPVSIMVSAGAGQPLKLFRVLKVGDSALEPVVSGRWYDYCFRQSAMDGYAQTQACGRIASWRTMNGSKLDGVATTNELEFLGR